MQKVFVSLLVLGCAASCFAATAIGPALVRESKPTYLFTEIYSIEIICIFKGYSNTLISFIPPNRSSQQVLRIREKCFLQPGSVMGIGGLRNGYLHAHQLHWNSSTHGFLRKVREFMSFVSDPLLFRNYKFQVSV